MGHRIRISAAHSGSDGLHILPKGARVLTLDGTLPAEYLAEGDKVITRDCGAVPLLRRRCHERRVNCVWLDPGSIAERQPCRRSLMPAQTMLYMRGQPEQDKCPEQHKYSVSVTPAGRLLNGVSVRYAGRPKVTLIELMFEAPHVLYVDGLEIAPITAQLAWPKPVATPRAGLLQ